MFIVYICKRVYYNLKRYRSRITPVGFSLHDSAARDTALVLSAFDHDFIAQVLK